MIDEDDNIPSNPDWDDAHLQDYLKGGSINSDKKHGGKCDWCNQAVSKGMEAKMGLTTHLKMGMLESKFRKIHGPAIKE
jgi:hypothetical protein